MSKRTILKAIQFGIPNEQTQTHKKTQTMLLAELILISIARSTQTIMVWGLFFGSLCSAAEIQNCFSASDWF